MPIRYIPFLVGFVLAMNFAKAKADDVVWFNGKDRVSYRVQEKVSPVVKVALGMFADDMKAVTGQRAEQHHNGSIEIIQLNMLSNKEFKKFEKRHLPYERIITHREAFYIGCHEGRVMVIGSDARGTAYGILELSRMAGVSPWVWWGDVVPEKKKELKTPDNFTTMQWPSVEYRGIFINDEDWSLRPWAHQKMDTRLGKGDIGPHTYRKLFELLLRLRANTLWPAMHEGTTPFFLVKGNREMADSCGIVIGSSHCEPLLRNNVGEWNAKHMGEYNYITNARRVKDYWAERIKETAHMDAIYTLGMRGIHDGSMAGVKTLDEKTQALQQVIDDQRQLIAKNTGRRVEEVPQVFIPYKEVLDIYENGLQVPDDVTLMWCDDNYGYMTRLSNEAQQRRKGGAGVYYHLSYWGRPHDYLWLSTTQPGLLAHEMRKAYDQQARRLWIANIHDPKVAAYDLSLFLDMAWNIHAVKPNQVSRHLALWLAQQFGEQAAKKLLPVMKNFYWLTTMRRPEFMGWSQVELDKGKFPGGKSPVTDTEFNALAFGNELETYLFHFEQQKRVVEEVEKTLRPELHDAFFTAVKYPLFAAAAMATKQLQAQEARHIARPESFHHDEEALVSAARSMKAYREIDSLTYYYNKVVAGGKWDGLMSMAPRQLPVFDEPTLPDQLSEEEIVKYSDSLLVAEQLSSFINQQKTMNRQEEIPGVIARNACDFTDCTEGVKVVEMLGHSMKAVSIPQEGAVSYRFTTNKHGDVKLRIAAIPTQPNNGGDLRFAVSIDGGTPWVFSLKEPFRSEQWKQQVLRQQAVREQNFFLTFGTHTLTIQALDGEVLLDQWMLDFDTSRKAYTFPVVLTVDDRL